MGYIIYQINDKNNKTLWIDQLVVDKNEREKGVARLLMNNIKDIAKKEDCIRIGFCCWSFNQNANNMYKHLGYDEQRTIFEKQIK